MPDLVSNYQVSDSTKNLPDLGREHSNLAALQLLADSTRPNLVMNQATKDTRIESLSGSNREIIFSDPFNTSEHAARETLFQLAKAPYENYGGKGPRYVEPAPMTKSQRLAAEEQERWEERELEIELERERILEVQFEKQKERERRERLQIESRQ